MDGFCTCLKCKKEVVDVPPYEIGNSLYSYRGQLAGEDRGGEDYSKTTGEMPHSTIPTLYSTRPTLVLFRDDWGEACIQPD